LQGKINRYTEKEVQRRGVLTTTESENPDSSIFFDTSSYVFPDATIEDSSLERAIQEFNGADFKAFMRGESATVGTGVSFGLLDAETSPWAAFRSIVFGFTFKALGFGPHLPVVLLVPKWTTRDPRFQLPSAEYPSV
jgi:hypothetical protein